MDKEKKNVPKKSAPDIGANAVNDDELSDVSGGLWGITILDTCPKCFDYFHCCKNFGKCSNLIINDENVRDAGLFKKAYSYVFSCAKGYFNQVSWADNAEDED